LTRIALKLNNTLRDWSRNSKSLYGKRLYIVKKLMERHNVRIYLSNSDELSGGKVILELLINLQKL
jgi:nitrogen fixation/metabolism regulation signal transduction histidine kinase